MKLVADYVAAALPCHDQPERVLRNAPKNYPESLMREYTGELKLSTQLLSQRDK